MLDTTVNGKVVYSVTVTKDAPSPKEGEKPAESAVSKPAVTAPSAEVDSSA